MDNELDHHYRKLFLLCFGFYFDFDDQSTIWTRDTDVEYYLFGASPRARWLIASVSMLLMNTAVDSATISR